MSKSAPRGITEPQIREAITQLHEANEEPTTTKIRNLLGTGSFTTIGASGFLFDRLFKVAATTVAHGVSVEYSIGSAGMATVITGMCSEHSRNQDRALPRVANSFRLTFLELVPTLRSHDDVESAVADVLQTSQTALFVIGNESPVLANVILRQNVFVHFARLLAVGDDSGHVPPVAVPQVG